MNPTVIGIGLLDLFAVLAKAWAGTTTTSYSYNADGALTAVTVQQGEGAAETQFLTWDNFIPDVNKPETGTLTKGNGRLVTIGSAPGGSAQFSFDACDRLLGQGVGENSQAYGYHANSLLASASMGTETLRYYQGSSRYPRMVNLAETSNGDSRWSARLGSGRYLSDGTEQILLSARKDTNGTLDPEKETLSGYEYEPFGDQSNAGAATSYDLADNPFRYAGEYRDPIWSGIYLRARWYHPKIAQFISRDPMTHLNRYGYGGGNPVMNVDPGGTNFFHSLEHDLQVASRVLNRGVGGHFARFFLSPIMGPLVIAADPKGFWEQIKHNKDGIDIFLAASVLVEGASIGLEGFGLSSYVRNLSLATRFGTRLTIDSGLTLAQSVVAGVNRGSHHFNWSNFAASAELGFGGLAYSRGVLGEGYHRYTLKGEDVVARVEALNDDTKILVFRERTQGYAPWRGVNTSPLAEWKGIGVYHERLIAVTREDFASNELVTDGGSTGSSGTGSGSSRGGVLGGIKRVNVDYETADDLSVLTMNSDTQTLHEAFAGRNSRYEYVGMIERKQLSAFSRANPMGYPNIEIVDAVGKEAPRANQYSYMLNNCHHHAAAVLRQLNIR